MRGREPCREVKCSASGARASLNFTAISLMFYVDSGSQYIYLAPALHCFILVLTNIPFYPSTKWAARKLTDLLKFTKELQAEWGSPPQGPEVKSWALVPQVKQPDNAAQRVKIWFSLSDGALQGSAVLRSRCWGRRQEEADNWLLPPR